MKQFYIFHIFTHIHSPLNITDITSIEIGLHILLHPKLQK